MTMNRRVVPLVLLCLLAGPVAAADAPPVDNRQLVSMPEPTREAFRQEMLDILRLQFELRSLVAGGRLAEAGKLAEDRLGVSAMGKGHAGQPPSARPGMHMPPAMREQAMGMHRQASAFAKAAQAGDSAAAERAYADLLGVCVSCHSGFRTR